jgi:hypothetical protein
LRQNSSKAADQTIEDGMARLIARIFGFLSFCAGMVVGILDGTRAIAANALDLTPFGATLMWLFPRQFPLLETAVTQNIHPLLWDPLLLNLFLLPAIAVLFGLGILLLILGRDKHDIAIGAEQAKVSGA